MGFSKKILCHLYEMSRDDLRRRKKIIFTICAVLLCCIVVAGMLIYSAVSGLKSIAASAPDLDLLALKELNAQKVLQLTDEQKARMIPLVKKISQETATPADRAALKQQLYGLLDPAQIRQLENWKSRVSKKAGEFTSSPQKIVSAFEQLTGISMQPLQGWVDALLSWRKITKREDNPQSLVEVLNEKK